MVLTGIISAATLSHGFVKYFQLFLPLPPSLIITILTVILAGVAIWGIRESATLILFMTLMEVGGLLMIIYYGRYSFASIDIKSFSFLILLMGCLLELLLLFMLLLVLKIWLIPQKKQ